MMLRSVASLLAALSLGPVALAAPSALGKYTDWTVFTETVGGETLCYAATQATDKAPQAADHGEVWFYVSSWRTGRARNQPSLKVGYDLRADLPGKAQIGRESWTLYGVGAEAFAQDSDDARLVRALKRGRELRVEATSWRNTRVTYHFSLSGSSSAIDRAAAACR
jgi:invasion protein IalB